MAINLQRDKGGDGMDSRQKVLGVSGLRTSFFTDGGVVPAVDGVDFDLYRGEVLGIVGESGCGKSVTSLSIMGLVPNPPGKVTGGEILYGGTDLLKLNERKMRKVRGNEIAMIFQEPMTSLNPLFTIGDQMIEPLRIHRRISKKAARKQAIDMLRLVGLPRAEEIMDEYPHQLSGGMRQRVMIAMALICEPNVLIADEPTTALDVTIQAQILKLVKDLNERLDTAVLLITHDLGVVAETCSRVIVMYAGKVVEEGPVGEIFKNPQHPYTEGLLKSVPDMRFKQKRLDPIPGNVPRPGSIRTGCRFAARCPYAFERCTGEDPGLYDTGDGHRARCFLRERKEAAAHEGALAEG